MKKHWKIVSVIAAAALLIGSVTVTVSARGPRGWFGGGTAAAPTEGWGPGFMPPGRMPGRGVDLDWEALAEELGYEDVDALKEALRSGDEEAIAAVQEAMKAAHKAALDQALADGKITQEQYDAMIERLESGTPPAFAPRMPGGLDMPGAVGGVLEAAADELGMSVQDLLTALRDGDAEALAAVKEAAKEAITQAVEDGTLTEEQAEWLLQGVERGEGFCGTRRHLRTQVLRRPWGLGRHALSRPSGNCEH